jgi:hypothetical protein
MLLLLLLGHYSSLVARSAPSERQSLVTYPRSLMSVRTRWLKGLPMQARKRLKAGWDGQAEKRMLSDKRGVHFEGQRGESLALDLNSAGNDNILFQISEALRRKEQERFALEAEAQSEATQEEESAATYIQSRFRGWRARQQRDRMYTNDEVEVNEDPNDSAYINNTVARRLCEQGSATSAIDDNDSTYINNAVARTLSQQEHEQEHGHGHGHGYGSGYGHGHDREHHSHAASADEAVDVAKVYDPTAGMTFEEGIEWKVAQHNREADAAHVIQRSFRRWKSFVW